MDEIELLKFCMATGMANAQEGQTGHVSPVNIQSHIEKITVKRLSEKIDLDKINDFLRPTQFGRSSIFVGFNVLQ